MRGKVDSVSQHCLDLDPATIYETAWLSVVLGKRRWEQALVNLDLGRLVLASTRVGLAKKGEVAQLLAKLVKRT